METYIDFVKKADYVGNIDSYMVDKPEFLQATLETDGTQFERDIDQYKRLRKALKLMLKGRGPLASGLGSDSITKTDKSAPVKELYIETPYGENILPFSDWQKLVRNAIRRDKYALNRGDNTPDNLAWILRDSGYFYADTGEDSLGAAEEWMYDQKGFSDYVKAFVDKVKSIRESKKLNKNAFNAYGKTERGTDAYN